MERTEERLRDRFTANKSRRRRRGERGARRRSTPTTRTTPASRAGSRTSRSSRAEGCRGSSEARRAPLARLGQRPRPRARGVWSSRWRRRVSARAFIGRRSGKASTLRWIRPSRPSRASTQRSYALIRSSSSWTRSSAGAPAGVGLAVQEQRPVGGDPGELAAARARRADAGVGHAHGQAAPLALEHARLDGRPEAEGAHAPPLLGRGPQQVGRLEEPAEAAVHRRVRAPVGVRGQRRHRASMPEGPGDGHVEPAGAGASIRGLGRRVRLREAARRVRPRPAPPPSAAGPGSHAPTGLLESAVTPAPDARRTLPPSARSRQEASRLEHPPRCPRTLLLLQAPEGLRRPEGPRDARGPEPHRDPALVVRVVPRTTASARPSMTSRRSRTSRARSPCSSASTRWAAGSPACRSTTSSRTTPSRTAARRT